MSINQTNNRDFRTSLKTMNFSYLNANNCTEAVRELTLTRPRDILYLMSEVPLADRIPVPIPGYYAIFDDTNSHTQKI